MKKFIVLVFFLASCSCGGVGDGDTTRNNDCSLTFTNDPGAAIEVAEIAADLGADLLPGDLPSNGADTEQGNIEIFFCSDVIAFDENEISLEGTLDLARSGYISLIQLKRVKP